MPLAEAEALIERPAASAPAEVRAAARETCFESLDVKGDVAGLRQLSLTCEQFTPQFGIEESESPESLLLDVTGCTHLFGGDREAAIGIATSFRERGFQARVGITPTLGAAWAASRFLAKAETPAVVASPQLPDALRPLPVESLRLPPSIIATLHELGLRSVGQLRALSRESLPSRFGPLLLKRLDQAFGDEPELLVPEKPRESLMARWVGEFPITDRESLHSITRELLDQLLNRLKPCREGLRLLRCELRDSNGRLHEFRIGFVAPTDQAKHVFEMLCLQWERAALPDEIAIVHFEATETEPLHVVQRDLFGHELDTDSQREVVTLLDRLSNRLGSHAVVRARLLPEAQPELAVAFEPWTSSETTAATKARASNATTTNGLVRPTHLFSPPQPIEVSIAGPEGAPLSFWWNRCEHRVIRNWGPERIETGWWRESAACRDYFRVEVQTGHHFWIFRRLDDRGWFIHGTFD